MAALDCYGHKLTHRCSSIAVFGLIAALALPQTWLSYASCFVLGKGG